MIDNYIRQKLPRYVRCLIILYKRLKLSPNAITLLGLFLSVIAAWTLYYGYNLAALLLWWFSRLLDGTDGIYAREIKQSSFFGSYLDINSDMFAYSIMIFFVFAQIHPEYKVIWQLTLLFYILCISSALSYGKMQDELGKKQKITEDYA